ncbi:MAG: alpha-galactosidase [Bacteroidaceae bacterium]|nr:alpha-galactosidase [Bacteroidaceae bacterium]
MKKYLIPLSVYLLLLASCAKPAQEENENLAPTMGWSSWNTYGININEQLIREQADAMAKNGLSEAGYQYINIDDGYFGGRDSVDGHLLLHPEKFPNGLRPLVDYIHGLGLKAGIYTDAGDNTCASGQGAEWGDKWGLGSGIWGHDQQDMDFWFVDCGFDFIKIDYCGGARLQGLGHITNEQQRYTEISEAMGRAAERAGRDDLRLNICRWAFPGTWAKDVSGSWRTTGDIWCNWGSVRGIIAENLYLSAYASPGHYNDMDMLEVGRGLSVEEDKTHFGLWCIMNSPLLIGCDMRDIAPEAMELMCNKELIALNQDPVCQQAYVVKKDNGCWLLVKDVEKVYGHKRAVAIYNPTDADKQFELTFSDVDLAGNIKVRDLFEHANLAECRGSMSVDVPRHGTRIYLLEAGERTERTQYEAETAYFPTYQELLNNQVAKSGIYRHNDAWSGGIAACYIGASPENSLQFRDVNSFRGGKYNLMVRYISNENRSMTISVNDVVVDTPTVNSGSWTTSATITIPVTLQKGNNVITFSNASAYAPDIDCITLVKR